MSVCEDKIIHLISVLGFTKNDGVANVYSKNYKNNYEISLNFDNKKIIYANGSKNNQIKVIGCYSSNFEKEENFVVLECIDRLLERGYKPNTIEIEKTWPSGHGTSGRLDILVRNLNRDPFLMIECKTWGDEYEKEKANMRQTQKIGNEELPKGQLFLYYWEEKKTEYLCLYTSRLNEGKIEYLNDIVEVKKEWQYLSNKKEVYKYWNKNFRNSGIFESGIMPYRIKAKALLRRDLEKINDDSSTRIFYQFIEILRHNSISDKSNAFNKLLNLFICKIIDEDKNENDEVLFQRKEDTTFISMQSTLADLYKIGMKKFLNIEVTDYSENDIDYILNELDDEDSEKIKKIIQDLRLQKNPDFAFKEVHNSESFEDNARVLKEIIELLQAYQFRYGHKQQFLGNFFELLLNSSIKQESGQFFTPIPIARFMVSSLPLLDIIENKIKDDDNYLLPIMVDYACGAGHFLTEYMDVLQDIINNYDITHSKNSVKNTFLKWKQNNESNSPQGEFEWAKDFVYGIEKDYMLVKTTKISTFLNGDGDANIIHADGLDNFYSEKYVGLLKTGNNNNKFDVVIANPPYSVNSFKQTLPCNKELFEVYPFLTENSSEIECLFIQRTRDLLKDGGVASLILPTSILNNQGVIHEKTRKILIESFAIKSIIEMGENTFMETGTNTMIVFLQKRKKDEVNRVEMFIRRFLKEYKDFSFKGVSEVIHKYVEESFDGILFSDYIKMINGKICEKVKNNDYYRECENYFLKSKEYRNFVKSKKIKKLSDEEKQSEIEDMFYKFLIEIETLHLKYYLLTLNEKTLIGNTGENKDEEKRFIGYEFSKRRGYEGIHLFKDETGHISTSLYDEVGQHFNSEKLDYYIFKMYKNDIFEIPECLSKYAKIYDTFKILEFSNLSNSCKLTLLPDLKIVVKPDFKEHIKLGDENFIELIKGTTITEKEVTYGDVPVVAGGKTEAYYHNVANRKANIITISASGSAGFVNYRDKPIFASDCYTVLSKDENIISTKFIYYCLKLKQKEIYLLQRGQNPVHVYPGQLSAIKIPKFDIKKQQNICNNFFENLNKIDEKKSKINKLTNEIETLINSIDKNKCICTNLGDEKFINLKRGPFGGDLKKEIFVSKGYKVYEQKNAIQNDVSIGRYFITKEKFEEMKSFEVLENDILMSCSGTIGKFLIITSGAPKGIINQALLRIRATKEVNPVFLKLALQNITNDFIKSSHGTGIENVSSIETLKKFKIYIPNISYQNTIEKKYNEIQKEINSLLKEISSIENNIENLINE